MSYPSTKSLFALLAALWLPGCFQAPAEPQSLALQKSPSSSSAAERSKLISFSPEASCLKSRRATISIDVSLVADETESVDFYTFLVVNGGPQRPFIISTTPGDIEVVQRAVWHIKLKNRMTNEVRLKVISLKAESGDGEQVIEATRHYRISGRSC
jgi:hypothetical protein